MPRSAALATAATGLLALSGFAEAKLDSNLHRSFYGLCYTSAGTVLPECGATQEAVTADILQIAQLTPRIKSYGSDCNQTALILQAIQDTGVDLLVYPTIYVDVPYNQTVVDRQWTAVQDAFKTYGVDHIGGLSVGNEFLLNSYGDGGEPTDSKGTAARTQLLQAIQDINSTLVDMDLGKHIPVGTADAGSAITEELCAGVDYFMGNDHPFFGNVPLDIAAGWTWEFFQDNDVSVCKDHPTQMFIGETGWPTAGNETSGGDDASVANLQTFLDNYVCQANTNSSEYFFFQYQNNDWAGKQYGKLEGSWGLFTSDNELKKLTIPDCEVDSPSGGTVDQSKLASMDTSDVKEAAASLSGGGSSGSSSSGSGSQDSSDDSSAMRSGVSVAVAILGAGALLAFV